jgi:membrane-bound lytic murein transglycosylase D
MPVDELLSLNAGYRRWATRPDGPHELLLPINRVEAFETQLAALPAEKRLRWQRHLIRRGDSLNRIAREYGVSVKAIKRTNGMTHSRIRAGRQLLIPLSDSATLAKAGSNEIAKQRLRYRVRKGDSLYTIARRFEVSIRDLKRWNRVGRYIHPGERLTVFIDPDA